MIVSVLDHHIEITPGVCGGKPRIAGHRITVQDIAIWHERLGRTADDICTEYDLTLSDVYAALAYYFDHRADVDAGMAAEQELAERMRSSSESLLAKKLMDRPGE